MQIAERFRAAIAAFRAPQAKPVEAAPAPTAWMKPDEFELKATPVRREKMSQREAEIHGFAEGVTLAVNKIFRTASLGATVWSGEDAREVLSTWTSHTSPAPFAPNERSLDPDFQAAAEATLRRRLGPDTQFKWGYTSEYDANEGCGPSTTHKVTLSFSGADLRTPASQAAQRATAIATKAAETTAAHLPKALQDLAASGGKIGDAMQIGYGSERTARFEGAYEQLVWNPEIERQYVEKLGALIAEKSADYRLDGGITRDDGYMFIKLAVTSS
jgi:hypothetical protein